MSEHQARLEAEHLLLVANEKLQLARQVQQHLLPAPRRCCRDLMSERSYTLPTLPAVTSTTTSLYPMAAWASSSPTCAATASVRPWWPWKPGYLRALAAASSDVGEILRRLNVFLCGDMAEGFVTLFFAQVDPRTQTLMFCGAGTLDTCWIPRAHARN